MPNKHFYFAMGVLHGAAVVTWVGYKRHAWFERYRWMRRLNRWNADWFLYSPGVMALLGCVALVPDLLHASDLLPKAAIRSDLFNVFYGYAWFEHMEDVSPGLDWLFNTVGSATLYTLAIGVLACYAGEAGRRLKDRSPSSR